MGWELVSFFLGVIALYFTIKSISRKKLEVVNVYSESTENFYLSRLGNINVSYNDEIFDNINAHEFVIFNYGTEGIDGTDILKDNPICFHMKSDSRIIDFELVSQSNEKIGADVTRVSESSITVNFVWLYKKSGIRIKILTDSQDEILVSGKIKKFPPLSIVKKIDFTDIIHVAANPIYTILNTLRKISIFLLFSIIILAFIFSMEAYLPKKNIIPVAYIFIPKEDIHKIVKTNKFEISDRNLFKINKNSSLSDDLDLYMNVAINSKIPSIYIETYRNYEERGYHPIFRIGSLTDNSLSINKFQSVNNENFMFNNTEVNVSLVTDTSEKTSYSELIYSFMKYIFYLLLVYFTFITSYLFFKYISIKFNENYLLLLNENEKSVLDEYYEGYVGYNFLIKLLEKI